MNLFDKYDIIYNQKGPHEFFAVLTKDHNQLINYILKTKYYRKGDPDILYDVKQEALLYVWKQLPKNDEQYSKFKTLGTTWTGWLYKGFCWGASAYIRKLYPKKGIRYCFNFDMDVDFENIENEEIAFDLENDLTYLSNAIKCLPLPEQKIINKWLETEKILESCSEFYSCEHTALKAFYTTLGMLQDDVSKQRSGQAAFALKRIKLEHALTTGWNHTDISFESHRIRHAERYYRQIKSAISNLKLNYLDIQELNESICNRILKEAVQSNEKGYNRRYRVTVLNNILKSLLDLKILRLNPILQNRFGTTTKCKIKGDDLSAPSEHVYLPEHEYQILKNLSKEHYNFGATSKAAGVAKTTLRRIINNQHGPYVSIDKIIKYLHYLSLTDLTSADGFRKREITILNKKSSTAA